MQFFVLRRGIIIGIGGLHLALHKHQNLCLYSIQRETCRDLSEIAQRSGEILIKRLDYVYRSPGIPLLSVLEGKWVLGKWFLGNW